MTSQSVDITTQLKIASTKLHAGHIVGQSQTVSSQSGVQSAVVTFSISSIAKYIVFLDIEYVERCRIVGETTLLLTLLRCRKSQSLVVDAASRARTKFNIHTTPSASVRVRRLYTVKTRSHHTKILITN